MLTGLNGRHLRHCSDTPNIFLNQTDQYRPVVDSQPSANDVPSILSEYRSNVVAPTQGQAPIACNVGLAALWSSFKQCSMKLAFSISLLVVETVTRVMCNSSGDLPCSPTFDRITPLGFQRSCSAFVKFFLPSCHHIALDARYILPLPRGLL